ncbi:hypothetical protein Cgig2_013546 [Carnegiea gigantea]|uniref:Protein root UVB sensitive 3 n=1 Tax=Carnegiea gigantea TaxID=171969 RepID=A0A9Q1JUJ6_9CARY|nr:hypothetical protein Cgig2_013546 [Carnegiea gigantea]
MAGHSSLSSTQQVMVEEWTGSSSSKLSMTATISSYPSISRRRFDSRFKSAEDICSGFPSSVTADYAPFQLWDSLQGLSTYIRTMLSTQALLSAIGVGEKSATVIGATFQWFLRDFTGMLGGILFTFCQGSNLDSNAKMWRLVADLMNDLGIILITLTSFWVYDIVATCQNMQKMRASDYRMLMDLISPLFPSAFVFIVCLGCLSRSFTGVASGATRAALTQHFALQDNAADISAKEGSQETIATMAGMTIGMLLARVTMGHSLAIWFSFLLLTIFHMYANYRAVRCLSLNTLNGERSSILLQNFMETGKMYVYPVALAKFHETYAVVLSPQKVSTEEHILPLWLNPWSSQSFRHLYKRIHLGVKVSSLSDADILIMANFYNLSKINGLVHADKSDPMHWRNIKVVRGEYLLLQRKGTIRIVMHKDSTQADVLQSYVHALVMVNLLDKSTSVHIERLSWMSRH